MNYLTDLAQEFKREFGLDFRIAYCLSNLIVALIKYKTVNLAKLVPILGMQTLSTSRYKRFQRFFWNISIDSEMLARFMMRFIGTGPYTLSMDRTNRKYGKSNINILAIGIVYHGIAIPVIWSLLDKQGTSNSEERIDLMERFLKIFGKDSIGLLLADREFIGAKRVNWLLKNKIGFILRVRNNTIVEGYGSTKAIYKFFQHDAIYTPKQITKRRRVRGIQLYITGMKTKDEYLIVISDKRYGNEIELYAGRWEIECLFGCTKTRGFNFESTHLTNTQRISTMMSVVSLAFLWAYRTGERKESIKSTTIKNHGRKLYSTFKIGLDILGDIFENIQANIVDFKRVLQLMYCT